MAPLLSVHVQWFDATIEHRLCRLREGAWLGSRPSALVSFPGMALRVGKDRWGWTLGGHRLVPGTPLVLHAGEVRVLVEMTHAGHLGGVVRDLPDPAPLIATAALVLASLWVEAAGHLLQQPEVAAQVEALLVGHPTAAEVPTEPIAEAPEAVRWRPAVELAPAD